MEPFFTFQEIIIVVNTKFAAAEYQSNDEEKAPKRPHADKLADACWNGMLRERLPEISITKNKKPLPIWELSEGRYLLYVKLGDRDERPDAGFTIHPYLFREIACLN